MRLRAIGPVQRALLLIVVIALLGTGAYFAFEYTVVAQVQEAILNPDTTDLTAYGRTLFQTRGCAGCHTLEDAGSSGDEGPDLTNIGTRHDAAYIHQAIATPNAVIAPQCPEGQCQANVMPPFGTILTPDQIDALVAYLMQP
jgi:mono/diheme cytochrome c family protein